MPSEGRHRLLVIDGVVHQREDLLGLLEREGFDIEIAKTAEEGVGRFSERRPELVLLGPPFPDGSGIDICRRLLRLHRVPVILVDQAADEVEVVRGLEAGAEDYITRPCRDRELVARIRAVLRRRSSVGSRIPDQPRPAAHSRDETIEVGPIALNFGSRRLLVDGRPVHATPKEFDLLAVLASPPEVLYTREMLIDQVWPLATLSGTRSLDKHIRGLRSKVEVDPANPKHLITIHGLGFRLQG